MRRTCKERSQVARLDRTQPPPGYTLTPSCGVWVADKHGQLIREADSFDDEANAIAAAWDHYEREHDPPGMVVWLDALAGDDVWWWGDEDRNYGPQEREEADARAAAWVWYWRRVAVANDLDNLSIRDFAGTPRGCVTRWPECLVWLDEQVFTVERWISNGGDTPEVLCA